MGQFEDFHPGGYFTLKKNYGRDITKFFNGAYKLVNTVQKEIQYVHRADARLIANSLVIANLKGQADVRPIDTVILNKFKVNKIANCFELKALN